jgi:hypothetical protein
VGQFGLLDLTLRIIAREKEKIDATNKIFRALEKKERSSQNTRYY